MSENALLDRTVDTALLDSLFDELVETTAEAAKPREFLGEWTVDSFGPDKFDESALASWHIAVRPLSFTLKSATGAFHAYEKVKLGKDNRISPQSAAGRVINSYREALGPDADGKAIKPGRGALVGRIAWFINEKLTFGTDKKETLPDGTPNPKFGQVISAGRASIMATRAATPEEIAKYVHGVTTAPAAQFSAEDVEVALGIMEGKKASIYQRGLIRNNDISAEVKGAILNGDMAKFLTDNGYAVEEDGVLLRADA